MLKLPALNFPQTALRLRHGSTGIEVWDELRRKWVAFTREERVRRYLAAYLVSHCGALPLRMVEEYPVAMNGQPQRADLVVMDGEGRPLLVAECKAPEVEIDRTVFDQAARYNSVLGARYLLLTNGLAHYCYELRDGRYEPLAAIPRL